MCQGTYVHVGQTGFVSRWFSSSWPCREEGEATYYMGTLTWKCSLLHYRVNIQGLPLHKALLGLGGKTDPMVTKLPGDTIGTGNLQFQAFL